jgi:D-alanyl-D-alanine carboxypeptidase
MAAGTSGMKQPFGAGLLICACALSACSSSSSGADSRSGTSPGSSSTSSSLSGEDTSPLANEVSSIRETLQSGVDTHVLPGAVVVVRRGSQTRTVAVGRADVATGSPMQVTTTFRIASITKSLVATATLELVAQGRLSLSDTVARWEPGLVSHGSQITVGELVGQTSGLPAFQTTRAFNRMHGNPPPTRLIALVAHAPLMFKPGSRSFYSNTNYLVLGLILQKVTHEPLTTILQQRIFGPLHLQSARLETGHGALPQLAHGYDQHHDVTLTDDVRWLWAAGGVVADAGDVARFYDALLRGRLVRGSLFHQMLVQHRETNHELPFRGYGLGLATLPVQCGVVYGHSGSAPGYGSYAWTSRNGTRSVVMLFNTSITVASNDYVVPVLDEALCSP